MIPCPKCGGDNLVGAIFCRKCGGRLNLDEIRPQTVNQARQAAGIRIGVIVYRVVLLLVVAVLLWVLVGFFSAPKMRAVPVAGEGDARAAEQQFETLFTAHPAAKTYVFSAAQLGALVNRRLGLAGDTGRDAGFALAPERLEIDCLASGYLRLTLRSRLKGKFAVYSTAIVRLDADGGTVARHVAAARAGRIRLPQSMQAFVTERIFQPFRDNQAFCDDLAYLSRTVTRLEVTDGLITLTVRPTARDKDALKYLFQRSQRAAP